MRYQWPVGIAGWRRNLPLWRAAARSPSAEAGQEDGKERACTSGVVAAASVGIHSGPDRTSSMIEVLMDPSARQRELERIDQRLADLAAERRELEAARLALIVPARPPASPRTGLTHQAAPFEKIALFRALFRGRTDVYPVRWENQKTDRAGYSPACANEWVRGVCGKPQVKCGDCPQQAFLAVTDDMLERHLRGDIIAGVYPLLPDNTCHFVAADFDGDGWAADSDAFLQACVAYQVPAARERSRGTNGHLDPTSCFRRSAQQPLRTTHSFTNSDRRVGPGGMGGLR